MTRKNSLLSLALVSLSLVWVSCNKSDPAPSAIQQAQNEFTGGGGSWKVDSAHYRLSATIAGRDTTFIDTMTAKMDTLLFQPVEEGDQIKPGHGGYRRGLLISQHTAGGQLMTDTMNWQIGSGPTEADPLRLVIFYNPGSEEQQYNFNFVQRSSSRMVLEATRAMSVSGQPGSGHRKYILVR